jgi:LmbE family N-acetylglucosaminyl deacetylase
MKVMSIHAHPDDFELTAAGTFSALQQKLGRELQAQVVVCTDGRAGHHRLTPSETTAVRMAEQEASAREGRYEFHPLRLPDGTQPREAGLLTSRELLAALWKAIRDFEPDYVFCPPVPEDPLAGIHVDHITVAEAVRRVAYLVNVPHAFLAEYPSTESPARPCTVPVILNVYDSYAMGSNAYDLAVDVEPWFEKVCAMTWCHQSQIAEWLPWVGRHDTEAPSSPADWRKTMRRRFDKQNAELGIRTTHAVEVFSVTAWGIVPTVDRLRGDLPGLMPDRERMARLEARLARWGAA